MNFIRDVLDIISENEIIDTKQQIEKLSTEVEECQGEIQSYIKDNYCDFIPNLSNNKLLLNKGIHLFAEIENLDENIKNESIKKNILSISSDLNGKIEQLKESSIGFQISIEILKINNLFEQIEMAQQNNEYLKNMEYLNELKCLIYDSTMIKDLLCYESLNLKYHNHKALFASRLEDRFSSLVQINEKSYQKTKVITLRITKDTEALNETMIVLFGSNYNIKNTCQRLLNNIFEPIITKPVSLSITGASGGHGGGGGVDIKNYSGASDDDFNVLNLSFGLITSEELRPNYKLVFENIKKVIEFLSNLNVKISTDLCVFNLFGEEINEKLLKLLTLNCLNRSIPETMDELLISTLKEDILEFNEFLYDSQLLNRTIDLDLSQFAVDIEILFKNRFYTNIIENAKKIMHQNIHDMSLVDDVTNNSNKNKQFDSKTDNESIIIFERCMVSKSALELTNFLDKILQQQSTQTNLSENSNQQSSSQLLDKELIITAILDCYVDEVITFNAKNLIEIPQQSALFYNNCIYLVHWLVENTKNQSNDYSVTIKLLHGHGNEYFQRQVTKQQDHIYTTLKKFIETKSPTEFDPFWTKIIRQCLRVLEFLKNVWQNVLPVRMYKKTIINLCNDFYLEILRRILLIEDIPLPVSNGLVEILENILDRTSSIFESEIENETFKSTQKKLSFLKMILTVTMAQIVEQWDHGKGPLSNHFKAEEIKHLIRALFQNTDRRAQALATIV